VVHGKEGEKPHLRGRPQTLLPFRVVRGFYFMRYRKGTFITVPNKDFLIGLDPQSQVLYMWLQSFANDNGECYPAIDTLADCCGMSRDTVIRRLEKLTEMGLITKQNQYIDNKQTTNLYTLELVDRGSTQQPTGSHTATHGGSREQHRTQSIGTQSNIYINSTKENKSTKVDSGNNLTSADNYSAGLRVVPTHEETGEPLRERKPKSKQQFGNSTMRMVRRFTAKVEEMAGVAPPVSNKQFFTVQNAAKKHELDEDAFVDLFDFFFNDNLSLEQKASLQLVCSDNYITKWKINRKNRPITQVEAAEGIRL
jgi:DNA-binding Lrp family transcriptional regulator